MTERNRNLSRVPTVYGQRDALTPAARLCFPSFSGDRGLTLRPAASRGPETWKGVALSPEPPSRISALTVCSSVLYLTKPRGAAPDSKDVPERDTHRQGSASLRTRARP